MTGWQVAGGSVTGTLHINSIKFGNCQDAFGWYEGDDFIIAVVTDGCSGGLHSEVGAKLGCQLVVKTFRRLCTGRSFNMFPDLSPTSWKLVNTILLGELAELISLLSSDIPEGVPSLIRNYFSFTIVGVLITPTTTTLFSAGDGFIIYNNNVIDLPKYPDNKPPYLAYNLLQKKPSTFTPESCSLRVEAVLRTSEIHNVVIGTDGVTDYLLHVPGLEISEFWQDDRYFQNSDQIRRRLALINKTNFKVRGPLRDDTTLVVVRRTPEDDVT